MSESFDNLRDVNPRKLGWNFKVYTIRVWEEPSRFNEKELASIDLIIQDSTRMRASIPKPWLKSGGEKLFSFSCTTCATSLSMIKKNASPIIPGRWTLIFSQRTTVNPFQNPTFPLEAFRFRTISDIINAERLDGTELFDLIAEVVEKEDPRDLVTSKGKETKRLAIVLEDLECVFYHIQQPNRVHNVCHMVDQILPHLEEDRVEPLIVVLQLIKATRWNGKSSVQSHFNVSQLHVDPGLKEIVGFRNMLLGGATSSSMRISQVLPHGPWSGAEELTQDSLEFKFMREYMIIQKGPTWMVGTIVSINVSKNDWFYKSCRKCPKKVDTPVGNRYECGKFGHIHGCAALRFKVEVMVFDGTGSIRLLLWNKKTMMLCGKRAEQVMEEKVSTEDDYPPTFDNMMDKRVLFKLNVKSGNISQYDPVYTVMRVCDDKDIIEKNTPKEVSTTPTINNTENGCSNSIDMSGSVVNLNTDSDMQPSLDVPQECISSLKCKTPAKRSNNGEKGGSPSVNEIEDEGQLSTNRFSRKSGKRSNIQIIEEDN
ncbi:hypothetical protein Ahy_B01g051829 [Arachis hypogaea]|uniref:Replication factor A C-terminal domain-containing protein n=1 Tax=Arachis hypogaea TaxID=3818 RepID=A0A445AMX8_ARAHY|nr:hypothetical protein Ahy_B01g051829 [Arachis hypogaea]